MKPGLGAVVLLGVLSVTSGCGSDPFLELRADSAGGSQTIIKQSEPYTEHVALCIDNSEQREDVTIKAAELHGLGGAAQPPEFEVTWVDDDEAEPAIGANGAVAGCDDDVPDNDAFVLVNLPAPETTTVVEEISVTYEIDGKETTVRRDMPLTLCAPRQCEGLF